MHALASPFGYQGKESRHVGTPEKSLRVLIRFLPAIEMTECGIIRAGTELKEGKTVPETGNP